MKHPEFDEGKYIGILFQHKKDHAFRGTQGSPFIRAASGIGYGMILLEGAYGT